MRSIRDSLSEEWPTAMLFLMTFYIISLTAFVPALNGNTLFRTLSQAIVITGLIGIALAYHYRSDLVKQNEINCLREENERLKQEIAAQKGAV